MRNTVGIIIFDRYGAVYLNLRDNKTNYYPLHWSLIGGHADEGESAEKAAYRELEEETGYKAKTLNFLSTQERDHPAGGSFISHIYWCEYDGKQTLSCFEGIESRFVPLPEIENLPIVPTIKDYIYKADREYRHKAQR